MNSSQYRDNSVEFNLVFTSQVQSAVITWLYLSPLTVIEFTLFFPAFLLSSAWLLTEQSKPDSRGMSL
ncbi:hypothetical protein GQ43DRAFT_234939 [Delitschia confertaspora ATCC 74209]|uniref:Uncharacterized protein n=1 Tax=Delitschia confertaspora ATCC 74209 TaxID=1513339 RepID=A0A9P4JFC6_9PLEO|nr:hypothetical protein GQ43DRAFT_234939 [Delitschia confertaspora ATCC 74209]